MAGISLRQYFQSLVHFERSQLDLPADIRKTLVALVVLVGSFASGRYMTLVLGGYLDAATLDPVEARKCRPTASVLLS